MAESMGCRIKEENGTIKIISSTTNGSYIQINVPKGVKKMSKKVCAYCANEIIGHACTTVHHKEILFFCDEWTSYDGGKALPFCSPKCSYAYILQTKYNSSITMQSNIGPPTTFTGMIEGTSKKPPSPLYESFESHEKEYAHLKKILAPWDLQQIRLDATRIAETHEGQQRKYRHDTTEQGTIRVPARLMEALIDCAVELTSREIKEPLPQKVANYRKWGKDPDKSVESIAKKYSKEKIYCHCSICGYSHNYSFKLNKCPKCGKSIGWQIDTSRPGEKADRRHMHRCKHCNSFYTSDKGERIPTTCKVCKKPWD